MLAAAYNAGPGNLQKWKSASRHVDDDPLFFIETMPSRETRLFIERVMANYWIYQKPARPIDFDTRCRGNRCLADL